MIAASGFREYDARWRFPQEIDPAGAAALGLALGTQMRRRGAGPGIVVGHDLRSYSPAVAGALAAGLVAAGAEVHEIGLALTPMAYFAQSHLGGLAVAMVTASHNPNGWSGVKMGFAAPLTHGPEEMAELRDIVLSDGGTPAPGGRRIAVSGLREAWLAEVCGGRRLTRPLRVVCATGNGTAGAFAPEALARIGVEVIGLHTGLDATFPHYNPNPEALEMLHDMAAAVRAHGADLALGFDGDGDRLGVVDDRGEELFADRLGLLLARDLAPRHPRATFVIDVKSTGLFATDPVLAAAGARGDPRKTGHSHKKSGHVFLAPPLGRGHDCALTAAMLLLDLVDRRGRPLSALRAELPESFASPTMSAACPDGEKYAVAGRLTARLQALCAAGAALGGHRIDRIDTVNGARAQLANGGFALVRPSSNTPTLVVVCESPEGRADLAAIFHDLDALIRTEPAVGAYDQTL
jgi:phosphomannomutase/phosphoglucomutase